MTLKKKSNFSGIIHSLTFTLGTDENFHIELLFTAKYDSDNKQVMWLPWVPKKIGRSKKKRESIQ